MSREERIDMQAALQQMINGAVAAIEMYENGDDELRNKFDEKYPFDKSFDEIVAEMTAIKDNFE